MQNSIFNSYWRAALALALAMGTVLPATALAQSQSRLGVDGLDGITASTRFKLSAVQSASPDLNWIRATRATEDGQQPVIATSAAGTAAVTLFGDSRGRIGRIEIKGGAIGNWLGPRIGDPFGPLQHNLQLGICQPGADALSGAVSCAAAETDAIIYIFSGAWNGPDGQLPPADVLEGWTLSQMIWGVDPTSAQNGTQQAQASPSFNCARADGSIETMICGDADLAALDRRLSMAYARALETTAPADVATFRAVQRGWIKGRNACWKSGDPRRCVVAAYTDRIAELNMTKDASGLTGTSWQGRRIAGDTVPRAIDINLAFGTDGRISGTSGCNRFAASVTIDGRNLKIGAIGSTRRLCPEIEMLAERRFLDALERVEGWAIRNGDLVLFGTGAELTFRRI
ncbi:MAG: DUF1131 family protein [Pseudomonadota bacterium]